MACDCSTDRAFLQSILPWTGTAYDDELTEHSHTQTHIHAKYLFTNTKIIIINRQDFLVSE